MRLPKIKQQITFLLTEQLDVTKNFYKNLLGLELILDQGRCLIFKVCSTGYIGFCEKAQVQTVKELIFTLIVDDVDDWYNYLVQMKIQVESPPAINHRYNIYHLFFYDPNGYLIEVQKFLDPKWPDIVNDLT